MCRILNNERRPRSPFSREADHDYRRQCRRAERARAAQFRARREAITTKEVGV